MRVNSDIRPIVHRSEQSLLLCYAVSVFNGPSPIVRSLKSEADETKAVGAWIAEQAKWGVIPHEFGVFVRSEAQSACRGDAKDSHPARKRIGEAPWSGFEDIQRSCFCAAIRWRSR